MVQRTTGKFRYTLQNKSTQSFEMIWSDTLGFYKNINDKYLNEGENGLQIFFNRYKIEKREDILRGLI